MNESLENQLKQRIACLEQRLEISAQIDQLVERCTVEQKSLALTMAEVFGFIDRELHPSRIFLRTMDEELRLATFVHNVDLEALERDHQEFFLVDERVT